MSSRRIEGVESARKVLALLLGFETAGPQASVAALARAAGLPLSSAYRHLALLREVGLVEEGAGAGYRLAPRIHLLARAADAASPLVVLARPELARLNAATGDTAVLFRLFGDVCTAVVAIESRRRARISGVSGRSFPLYRGAPSKVLLASLAAAVRKAYLDRVERIDAGFAATRPALEAELALIRRRGWAESHGEIDPGMWAIAAPVVQRRRAIAALWLAGPDTALTPGRREAIRAVVTAAAARLSQRLAGVARDPVLR